MIDNKFNFTSDYELRVYTFACYYFDFENNYRSDGLTVGSLTNSYQAECYSNHSTTFFIVLPSPINWNYAFAHLDFMQNKIVYSNVITVSCPYRILMIYARRKDQQDLEKWCVMPLMDSRVGDWYYDQIWIFIGQRIQTGTNSKVYFILFGAKKMKRVLDD